MKPPIWLLFLLLVALVGCQRAPPDELESTAMPAREITTERPPGQNSRATVTRETATPTAIATAGPSTEPVSESDTTPTAEPSAQPIAESATEEDPTPVVVPTVLPPGALIQVSMESQVGVLLDEIPKEVRDQIAASVLERPDDTWLARAQRQIRLTKLRLNFRNFRFEGKGQLPLPPQELWSIRLDPAGPSRQMIQGHDLIVIGYTLTSVLLTDADSPGRAEPALAEVGGIWLEPFILPVDPDLLLQRTDNACINESGFPPNSYDSENIWNFYDFDCEANSGGALGCHRTRLPELSCRQAVEARVGEIETAIRFERLAWDGNMGAAVRLGPVAEKDAPDLVAVGDDLETNRIIYRYINPDDCAVEEASVGGSGWRRLLQFSATVHNVGGQPLHIGPVVAEDPANRVINYSLCHDHFHYNYYGEFSLASPDRIFGSKQAFCVQSTNRFSNNELSPLTHDYSCRFQGIQAGWVDEYGAGLNSQWIDITDLEILPEGLMAQLEFTSNGDRFLCEGMPVLDENGEQVWEPSGFTTESGADINRPQCDFIEDWDENNRASREIFIPAMGSFVTMPCTNDELGPLRNCGFEELPEDNTVCPPGTPVERTFRVENVSTPQILRICERSAVLGTGVACTYEDALTNVIVGGSVTEVSFICPRIRDAEELGGGYALYAAPLYPAVDVSFGSK